MTNPLANLPATVRPVVFTAPTTGVTFTAACPQCHQDREWSQANNNSALDANADAAPMCECEPA